MPRTFLNRVDLFHLMPLLPVSRRFSSQRRLFFALLILVLVTLSQIASTTLRPPSPPSHLIPSPFPNHVKQGATAADDVSSSHALFPWFSSTSTSSLPSSSSSSAVFEDGLGNDESVEYDGTATIGGRTEDGFHDENQAQWRLLHPFDNHRGRSSEAASAASGDKESAVLLGDKAHCRRDVCRLCDSFRISQSDSFIPPHVRDYLAKHVLIAIITGSFDQFFRMDLALCTWAAHIPDASLHVFTDAANQSDGRRGTWHEALLPPSMKFSSKQQRAQGYTIHWIRAQFRFFQAFQTLGTQSLQRNQNHSGISSDDDVRWVIVVDDDTFVDLVALVRMLHDYDAHELMHLQRLPSTHRTTEHNWDSVSQLVAQHKLSFRPLYLGEKGWGGAGHFMNVRAMIPFVNQSDQRCVAHYMVRKGFASDVTMMKCLPLLGIHAVKERRLSHCQANFLKKRLLNGVHVSSHIKRDVVKPRNLAIWRARLYYQVVYHKNHTTAYDLLMRVGACAYGSCKIGACDKAHDDKAVALFEELSGNNSFVPSW